MYAKKFVLALEEVPEGQSVAYVLDIIPYCSQWELGPISLYT